jgi:[acyl-carrier-protein] S-malonyltransferase
MSYTFVFPGQGSQAIGMGKDVVAHWPEAKAVFDEVDEALGEKLSDIIFEGDIETLTLTHNAQPALMATSMAVVTALKKEGVTIEHATYVAGHSLGEYSALCAVGALSLSDTARLLRLRGQAMQSAVPVGQGAMAAIIGVDLPVAQKIAAEAAEGEVCEAANDNAPGQVVLSGTKTAIDRAIGVAKNYGAKRALALPVSAPFHCQLMQPAAEVMREALSNVEFRTPVRPVVTNVRAEAVSDPDTLRALLVEQVTGSVRWRESVLWMVDNGVTELVELGAGKVLSGMAKRISPDLTGRAINTPDDINSFVQEVLS